MRVESREGNVETTLTSDPPLPEDEVASLMLSGQRTPSGSAGEVVTSQLMQALSGEIVGTVGRAIGFDAVRVESGNPADLAPRSRHSCRRQRIRRSASPSRNESFPTSRSSSPRA